MGKLVKDSSDELYTSQQSLSYYNASVQLLKIEPYLLRLASNLLQN